MGANAQTTVPTFVASQVLTADQQNQSARTGVPVFATTVTRDAAFGGAGEKTLAEGQLCYVEGTGLQTYNGTAWVTWGLAAGVVQVKSTTKTDTFTVASATYTDVTGLSVSITPTSANNKILVLATINGSQDTGVDPNSIQLVRGSTAIGIGDAAGSRVQASASFSSTDGNVVSTAGITFLDSPATTSATTYKIQVRSNQAANNVFVNRCKVDTNGAISSRTISTIAVLEVAP